jgi:hypothetical protein
MWTTRTIWWRAWPRCLPPRGGRCRVSLCARPHRAGPVRHDLPRASVLLLRGLGARTLFERHGLHLNDVVRVPIHGGSLRLTFGNRWRRDPAVAEILTRRNASVWHEPAFFDDFARKVRPSGRGPEDDWADEGLGMRASRPMAPRPRARSCSTISASTSVIEYRVDRNPLKQGRYMPGVRVPMVGPEVLGCPAGRV